MDLSENLSKTRPFNQDEVPVLVGRIPSDEKSIESIYDIGNYIGKSTNEFTKRKLLLEHWIPPENYEFPVSVHNKGNRKTVRRSFNHTHLQSFEWLVLSDAHKGLYCKYCSLFVSGHTGGSNKTVPLQQLVTKPLMNFKKLLGKDGHLILHSQNKYHINAVLAAEEFLKRTEDFNKSIKNQIDKQRLQQITENRERLIPIIESIIFLGRQNIPLRGHRDDGPLFETAEKSDGNEGNFRELLRFRVKSGDVKLENHLKTSQSRATYTSKNTQNELIKCCGEEISDEIIKNVKDAGVYSIIFDETTDIAHQSQLSLNLRYLHDSAVREDFIDFINIREEVINSTECHVDGNSEEPVVTGRDIGIFVLDMLKRHSLDVKKCVGISTDGCSIMISTVKGAIAEIKKECLNAVRCPCYNHALNLSISKSSTVQGVRNAVGTINEIATFFTASSKRNVVIKRVLKGEIKSMCETRWIERHDSIIQFKAEIENISDALIEISNWNEQGSASKAKSFLCTISSSDFLLSLFCLCDLLVLTLPLSRLLQKKNVDVLKAQNNIEDLLATLTNKRQNCESHFKYIYNECVNVAQFLGIDLCRPRIPKKQLDRLKNVPSDTESYFRQTLYIPLLDNVIADINDRFDEGKLEFMDLISIMPHNMKKNNRNDSEQKSTPLNYHHLKRLSGTCNSIFGNPGKTFTENVLRGEITMWERKWQKENDEKVLSSLTALDVLNECQKDLYPNIYNLLKVFVTLPVSVATAERSFSALRRLKTWLRSKMSEDRLVGLALLTCHRDITININNVIERFAQNRNRRLEFLL